MNTNETTITSKANAKALPAKSITDSSEWMQAMVDYCDRCIEFSRTEEFTPQADAAEQAMSKAFTNVADIVDRFFS